MKKMLNLIQSVVDTLDCEFYAISFGKSEVTFQGRFDSKISKGIVEKFDVMMSVSENGYGYVEGEKLIDGYRVKFVLT